MKKKFSYTAAFATGAWLAALVAGNLSVSAQTAVPVNAMTTKAAVQQFEAGQPFSVKELPFNQSMVILNVLQNDVTGDGQPDDILLIGHKEKPDDQYSTEVTVAVRDGKTQTWTAQSTGAENGGYEPTVFNLDFDQDGVSDLLVELPTGGSGGTSIYSLLTFKGGKGMALADQDKLNAGLPLDVRLIDGFKAEMTNRLTGKKTVIDVSENRQHYIESKTYDSKGKLLAPVDGAYDGFAKLVPQWQPDGTILLEGTQKIWGIAHADTIGTAQSVWGIEKGQLQLKEATITAFDHDNLPSQRVETGKPFKEAGAKANELVVDAKYADVNNDGTKDDVLLVGTKEWADSIYMSNLRLVVKDGKSGKLTIQSVGSENSGYEPSLYIGTFDQNNTKDVLVQMATGGSGGTSIYSLLTFSGQKIVELVPQEQLNQGMRYDVQFIDQFKVQLTGVADQQKQLLDVSGSKADYRDMQIYNENGKLLQPTEGMVDGFGVLQPVDVEEDGVLELKGMQRISGAYHADGLATAVSTWKVQDGKLVLLKQEVVPLKK